MMNLTDDTSVNNALNVCETGGRMAFHLSRWLWQTYGSKKPGAAEEAATRTLVSDALSYYRGGWHEGGDELRSLMSELAGTDDVRLSGQFFYVGDDTDLSVFWAKTDRNTNVQLPRSTVDSIPDEGLKRRVLSTLASARLDEKVSFEGGVYSLTDKGRREIYRPDFIRRRLKTECRILGISAEALSQERSIIENDRISRRLSELGLDGKYDGCERVTLNKKALFISEDEAGLKFYVPGTSRRMSVTLPKENVIELDEKTYAVFLPPKSSFNVTKDGKPGSITTDKLINHFESKNLAEDILSAADRGEAAADAPSAAFSSQSDGFIPEGSSFNTKDFFEAAVRHSYGHDAGLVLSTENNTSVGDELVFFTNDGDACRCLVTRILEDETSARHLKLHPLNGEAGDILMPEQAVGKVLFRTEQEGRDYLSSHTNEVKEYSDILQKQLETAAVQDDRVKTVAVSTGRVMEAEGGIWVSPPNAAHEQVFVPDAEVTRTDAGYSLSFRSGSQYAVKTGQYEYKISGSGAADILSASKKVASRSVKATAAGAKGAAAVGSAGIGAAAVTVPPIEPVSATVKTVLSAAAGAAQTGTSLSKGALDLTRRI